MSTILILAPVVVTSWPLIAAAVTSALCSSTIGYTIAKAKVDTAEMEKDMGVVKEDIVLQNSEILGALSNRGESITVQKDDIVATFSRSVEGELQVSICGENHSHRELREIADELIGRVTQQYAYHRLVTEMKAKGMTIIDESVEEDETVKIHVRSW